MNKFLFFIVILVILLPRVSSIPSQAQTNVGNKIILPIQKSIEARKGMPIMTTTAKQAATPQPTPQTQMTGK